MRRLTLAEVEAARQQRGRAALLYLTDRCPVGCAHCSVDARRLGARITDWALFSRVLDVLCHEQRLSVVGISGGEPFVERRGLTAAAHRLSDAGKLLVPYTSGHWGAVRPTPPWLREVLRLSSCLVLSTDTRHSAELPADTFAAAARTAASEGVWIGCQVVDGDGEQEAAQDLLRRAFGAGWESYAEIAVVPLLPYGRAAGTAPRPAPRPGAALGRCTVAATPVVRYDGRVAACCNEVVAAGGGPAGLRRHTRQDGVLAGLAADPYLTALGSAGAAALTALPQFGDLAQAPAAGLCDLCWRMVARGTDGPAVRALALLAARPDGGAV